jgi:hypothetical protein
MAITWRLANSCIDTTILLSYFAILKKPQQIDARGSTFNNIGRDQHNNIQIVINNPLSLSVEEVNENIDTPVCPF